MSLWASPHHFVFSWHLGEPRLVAEEIKTLLGFVAIANDLLRTELGRIFHTRLIVLHGTRARVIERALAFVLIFQPAGIRLLTSCMLTIYYFALLLSTSFFPARPHFPPPHESRALQSAGGGRRSRRIRGL